MSERNGLMSGGVPMSYERDSLDYEFKIDADVAIPAKNHRKANKYPFRRMGVGDSFFVPAPDETDARRLYGNVKCASTAFIKAWEATWEFTARRVEGGVRIWRIK